MTLGGSDLGIQSGGTLQTGSGAGQSWDPTLRTRRRSAEKDEAESPGPWARVHLLYEVQRRLDRCECTALAAHV